MQDYYQIINQLSDKWQTAKELGIASATLTAMVKRELIEVDRNSKPFRYKKTISSAYEKIKTLLEYYCIDDSRSAVLVHPGRGNIHCIKKKECGLIDVVRHIPFDNSMTLNITDIFIYENGFPYKSFYDFNLKDLA